MIITPPDQGAVAPNVVRVPEAPPEAAIVDVRAWDALADWVLGGGRLAACAIADLARLASIASPQFAVLIGEVAAQRALELAWAGARARCAVASISRPRCSRWPTRRGTRRAPPRRWSRRSRTRPARPAGAVGEPASALGNWHHRSGAR